MFRSAILVVTLFTFFSAPAYAELGDYGFWTTLKNLVKPKKADNPVTAAQMQGDYPLLLNPNNFNDGFRPGKYRSWQTVQLSADTGAVCGNGTPYKFFVNRVAGSSNTLIYYEGGGACWDFDSCSGREGVLGARNPDGIPDNYMRLANPAASLVSPFIFRLNPWTRIKTQKWNLVYVPYCTGDIYFGDTVAVYEDETGEEDPLVWHHNGLRNSRAVTAWLKNNLQQPAQLMITGCSAGGVGALTNYHPTRRDIDPTKAFLFNDSGPIHQTLNDDDPSTPLANQIRTSWGLDDGEVNPIDYLQDGLPALDDIDLGTINQALSETYFNDRMGHAHFWDDFNFSRYSYERFYEDIFTETDADVRRERILDLWHQDTETMISNLSQLDNFGYYFPRFRDVNDSHCTSIIQFQNADIQEAGLELDDFVDNILDGSGTVLEASESDTQADYNKGFNLLYFLLGLIL